MPIRKKINLVIACPGSIFISQPFREHKNPGAIPGFLYVCCLCLRLGLFDLSGADFADELVDFLGDHAVE